MKTIPILRALALVLTLVLTLTSTALHAQVPQIINYQGRVAVGDPPVNFDGPGAFKFALVQVVQGEAPTLLWKNDGSAGNTEPATAVTLPVTKGLYSVLLGANMTPIPTTVFANEDVRLRVWFDDGTANGSQLLTPDQRIAAVGYAMMADTVADGAIGSAKLAANLSISGNLGAGSFSGNGSQLTGINTGSVFVRWGTTVAPAGTTLLYSGIAFGGSANHPQAGGPHVIAGNDPGAFQTGGPSSLLFPLVTGLSGAGVAMPAGITADRILKGAVCHAPGPVTTIWGTWVAPDGWSILYKGYAMGGTFYSTIVVDADEFDVSMTWQQIGGGEFGLLYPTTPYTIGGTLFGPYPSSFFLKAAVITKSPPPAP